MSYCELPEFYEESFPRARKEHRCVECSAPIAVGEKHLSYRAKWPGIGFGTGRQHLLCRDACMFIRDHYQDGECIGFGELFEYWREYGAPYDLGRWKREEKTATFRGLMAGILWRIRFHRKAATNG